VQGKVIGTDSPTPQGQSHGSRPVLESCTLVNMGDCPHGGNGEGVAHTSLLPTSEGGTAAAPAALMNYMGLPIAESLPMLVDHLIRYGLRERVKVICSGKMITPAAVAWALCIGADFIVSARGFMFSLGCIQAMQCNQNSCPTGITTHNARLQRGLDPEQKSARVKNYVEGVLHDVAIIAHSCGVKAARDLRRDHARMVTADGKSISLLQRYPEVDAKPLSENSDSEDCSL